MSQTLENLLVYGSLGAGVALMLSDHRRLGMFVALTAPITVAVQHPRATWSTLRKTPDAVACAGKYSGIAMGRAGRAVGESVGRAGKAVGWAFS